MGKIVTKLFTR